MSILLSSNLSYRNNFDFLRVFSALFVLIAHSCSLSGNKQMIPNLPTIALSCLFVVSGFLITWSYINNSDVKNYVIKRIKRVIPAYYLLITLCVLLLSLISSYSLYDYFHSQQLLKYIAANLTFLNFLEPELPGVFTNNPEQVVNGSLWTLKVEITLYACVPVFCFLMKKMNKGILCAVIYILSVVFSEYFIYMSNKESNPVYSLLAKQFVGQLMYFISGTDLLLYFDNFRKYAGRLFLFALIIVVLRFSLFSYTPLYFVVRLLYPISLAGLVIGFAFNFKWLNNFGKYGDFSYGMYIYHYPVIQTLVYLKVYEYSFIGGFLLTLLMTFAFSFFSWNSVEKHFLKRRLKQ
jgi:peptidoglycan/LPS O-acetylase OafA/YrhL